MFASCGGDGGSGALSYGSPIGPVFQPYPALEGVYRGTLSGSGSADVFAVVRESDGLWLFPGQDFGNTFIGSGLYAGEGASGGGSYVGRLRDYGAVQTPAGRVSGTYDGQLYAFNGSIGFDSGTLQFATRWFEGAGGTGTTGYAFERPASTAAVAGHWDLLAPGGEGYAVEVGADGSLTLASTAGCTASGTLLPGRDGRNVHELRLVFGAAPCALPGQAVSGIAISWILASGQRQFLGGVVDATQTWGTALFGVR